mmetsp:Transcript_31453/g.48154  ORF Transcript_31453/g.48154 Transcript_31453/m.48154 type:complete len:216 (+) Transcript_31453:110-757(+)
MKEVLSAPVYENSPLHSVAERFWEALAEAQRASSKNEEWLEHSLGKLKGDFLLARAEWEEKLTEAQDAAEVYKKKYVKLRENPSDPDMMEQARVRITDVSFANQNDDGTADENSKNTRKGPASVASIGSGIAHQARTLVETWSCAGIGDRTSMGERGSGSSSFLAEGKDKSRNSSKMMNTSGSTTFASTPGSSSSSRNNNFQQQRQQNTYRAADI